MPSTLHRLVVSSCVLLTLAVAPAGAKQEALQKVKALYAAAAYEDALAVVAALPADTRAPELNQYRAFCLIALGQTAEAQSAIEALLLAAPLYVPDPAETSPRVIETFNDVRARLLPSITRKLYAEAKTALERKMRNEAITGFETLLRVIGSIKDPDETLDDMKVLAQGFLDLSRVLPEAPAPAATPAAPPAAAGDSASATASAAPVWIRPVAVKQDMPRWNAPDPISRRSEFNGLMKVRVGATGRVESAEIVRRAHPMYDALVLAATQGWVYEPARQDGVPVAAEVLVEIRLRPQE